MAPAPVLLSLAACHGVLTQYEVAKTAALADPGAAPPDFAPDAQILLSGALVDDVVGSAVLGLPIETTLDLGLVTIHPRLEVKRFGVEPGQAPDTLAVDLRLEGTLTGTTLLGTTSTPIAVDARVEAGLQVSPGEGTTAIEAVPTSVERLDLEVPGLASQGLAAWMRDALVTLVPKVELAELPADALPVTGLRVHPDQDGVRIDLRTAAPHPKPLPALAAPPRQGFRVRVSVDTLLQLARARAFAEPPLAHGVVVEPVSLELRPDPASVYGGAPVTEGSEGMPFALGLVLWRPVGSGWWRSYEVDGRLVVREGEVELHPDTVKELEHSRGAAVADPLVALAEGTLSKAIGRALLVTLPTGTSGSYAGVDATVRVDRLVTVDGALQADGSVEIAR